MNMQIRRLTSSGCASQAEEIAKMMPSTISIRSAAPKADRPSEASLAFGRDGGLGAGLRRVEIRPVITEERSKSSPSTDDAPSDNPSVVPVKEVVPLLLSLLCVEPAFQKGGLPACSA